MKKIGLILIGITSVCLVAQEGAQTSVQIREQKSLADRLICVGAVEKFKTPLQTFNVYFGGIVNNDSSKFQCLTKGAIQEWFEVDQLLPEDLDRIKAGHQAREENGHVLVRFVYKADMNQPEIVFSYRYTYKVDGGQRATNIERERLVFIQTSDGWKIKLVEADPD